MTYVLKHRPAFYLFLIHMRLTIDYIRSDRDAWNEIIPAIVCAWICSCLRKNIA